MHTQDILTVTQAAGHLKMTRQAIAQAAKKGVIGRKQPALGTRDGWVYVFTRDELDAWYNRRRPKGGRSPKASAVTLNDATIPLE